MRDSNGAVTTNLADWWILHKKSIRVAPLDKCVPLGPKECYEPVCITHLMGYLYFWPTYLRGDGRAWRAALAWPEHIEIAESEFAYIPELPWAAKIWLSEMTGVGFAAAVMRRNLGARHLVALRAGGAKGGRYPDALCVMDDGQRCLFEAKGTGTSTKYQLGQLRKARYQLGKTTDKEDERFNSSSGSYTGPAFGISTYLTSEDKEQPSRIVVVDPREPVPPMSEAHVSTLTYAAGAGWLGLQQLATEMAETAGWGAAGSDIPELCDDAIEKAQPTWSTTLAEELQARELEVQEIGGVDYLIGARDQCIEGVAVRVGLAKDALKQILEGEFDEAKRVDEVHREEPILVLGDRAASRGPAGTMLLFESPTDGASPSGAPNGDRTSEGDPTERDEKADGDETDAADRRDIEDAIVDFNKKRAERLSGKKPASDIGAARLAAIPENWEW